MKIFDKLNTLLRAGVRESVEQLTDANAIRIYHQEIVDAEELLTDRREALAATIATRKETEADIENLQRKIRRREQQVSSLEKESRTNDLLQLAAREIASCETQLQDSKRRHAGICEVIRKEELALRALLGEIKQHRRDIKLLESQLCRQRGLHKTPAGQTVSGRLAALRQTREAISDCVSGGEYTEAGMAEALERVASSPLDRELVACGAEQESQHIAAVLTRLQSLAGTA